MRYPRATGTSTTGHGRQIAVVGGGVSAVCLLDALAESGGEPGGITVFETSCQLWRGRAFQLDLETVRVNIPPEGMSLRFGDTTVFREWLADRGGGQDYLDPFCGIRFVPRGLFGDYLAESAMAILAKLRQQGWRIHVVRESVLSASRLDDGLVLETEFGNEFQADHTVLCVGRGKPTDIYGLGDAPGFVPEPYPLSRTLASIPTGAEVAVIGSGLTGIDVVLGLAQRSHRGRIRLLSRSGVLPMVRQRPFSYDLKHFTPETFRAIAARGERIGMDDVIAVMRAEFAAAGEDLDAVVGEILRQEHEDPVALLRRHLAEVDSSSLGLRILQRVVPVTGPDVWPVLTERDKNKLIREHYRAVMSVCCPMPPTTGSKLLGLIDAGQLEVGAGLQDVEAEAGGGFAVTTAGGPLHVDYVINAVNVPADKIPAKAEPLISSLRDAGLAEQHPRGGVHVERATSSLTVNGVADSRLYALGDLASGSLFFTFGLPSLVDRAYDIAGAVTQEPHALQNAA